MPLLSLISLVQVSLWASIPKGSGTTLLVPKSCTQNYTQTGSLYIREAKHAHVTYTCFKFWRWSGFFKCSGYKTGYFTTKVNKDVNASKTICCPGYTEVNETTCAGENDAGELEVVQGSLIGIIAAVAIIVVLGLLLLAFFIIWKKKRKKCKSSNQGNSETVYSLARSTGQDECHDDRDETYDKVLCRNKGRGDWTLGKDSVNNMYSHMPCGANAMDGEYDVMKMKLTSRGTNADYSYGDNDYQ